MRRGGKHDAEHNKVKHLAELKTAANRKAGDVLRMEGTLARLVAENAKHASAVPTDFSIKQQLDTPDKHGLTTGSTSKEWMEKDNTKMLEQERASMEKALEADYKGKRDAHQLKAMKQRMNTVMRKMEQGMTGKMNERVLKARQTKVLHSMSKRRRLKRLKDMLSKEHDLVKRYHHLRHYRKKMKLTVEGKVDKLSANFGAKVEKVSGGKPAVIKNAQSKPSIVDVVPGPTVPSPKASEDKPPVKLASVTHRRRNPMPKKDTPPSA